MAVTGDAPKLRTCRLCTDPKLYVWKNDRGKFYLADPETGRHHVCSRNRIDEAKAPAKRDELGRPIEPPITHPNGAKGLSESEIRAIVTATVDVEVKNGALDLSKQYKESYATLAEMIREAEAKLKAKREVIIMTPDGTVREVGRQHKAFDELVTLMSLKNAEGHHFNVLMVGPAGGGKSSAAKYAADALDLRCIVQPMGRTVTESKLLGWFDANGKLVRTLFREAYENGGVFVADEMDACEASALTALNGAIANGRCGFPDGMVDRHKDFIFVGGANTWGKGADRLYVGRAQLDAATLDRFLNLEWEYDEDFEAELAGEDMLDWTHYVQRVRHIVFKNKLRVVVSPRVSIDGAALLRQGISRTRVEALRLWNGISEPDAMAIRNNL